MMISYHIAQIIPRPKESAAADVKDHSQGIAQSEAARYSLSSASFGSAFISPLSSGCTVKPDAT